MSDLRYYPNYTVRDYLIADFKSTSCINTTKNNTAYFLLIHMLEDPIYSFPNALRHKLTTIMHHLCTRWCTGSRRHPPLSRKIGPVKQSRGLLRLCNDSETQSRRHHGRNIKLAMLMKFGSMNKKNNGKECEYMFYDQIELVRTAVLDDKE